MQKFYVVLGNTYIYDLTAFYPSFDSKTRAYYPGENFLYKQKTFNHFRNEVNLH